MASFKELYNIIQSYEVITLWGHALPDGDCYGCQIALREVLKEAFPNKRIYAIGSGMPNFFDRLGRMDQPADEEISRSLGIIVDVSCIRRVESPTLCDLCESYIKFDHHSPNKAHEPFECPCYVDPERIAAAEILYDFFVENGLRINKIAAEALYLGMATDSGRFIFHGTTSHSFQVVVELYRLGADLKRILDIAYYERKEVRQFKAFMKRHTHCRGQVDYCVVRLEDYERFGVTYEEGSSYVNAIAGRHRKPIYMLAAEDPQGNYRVELRSNKRYPVHQTAVRFGGGGHRYAAGCSIIDGNPTVDQIIDALNEVQP